MTTEKTSKTIAIPLTEGKFALIDESDYDLVSKLEWYWEPAQNGRTAYAKRNNYVKEGNRISKKVVSLHRFLLNFPEKMCVDHINGDGLDNRRSNLRIVTKQQNLWNQRKYTVNVSSKYKGVRKRINSNTYQCRIMVDGKRITVGEFSTEEKAAYAYNLAAEIFYGEFACLNQLP